MAGVGGSPLAPRGHRAPIAPSGPDQGAIALSLLALLYKFQGGILSKTGGEVGPEAGSARILGGCGAVADIA